jgi:hypothetical protein
MRAKLESWYDFQTGGILEEDECQAARHPADGDTRQVHGGQALLGAVFYVMCDDLQAVMKALKAKKVRCTEIATERWGIKTTVRLPSGGEIGLYQPTHRTAIGLRPD